MAQETFLAVWTHARSFRGGHVRAWLFSIAWRKAKGAQRSWFRRRRRDSDYHDSASSPVREIGAEDRLAVTSQDDFGAPTYSAADSLA